MSDTDDGLTTVEREFKRAHPETWRRMQEEKAERAADTEDNEDAKLTPLELAFKRAHPRTWEFMKAEKEKR